MLGKTLILVNIKGWREKQILLTGLADVEMLYYPVSKFQKKLRNVHYHMNGDKSYWYGNWKYSITQYDTIILFDAFLGSDVAEYIEKKSPNTRLIVFYGNPWFNNYYLSDEVRKKCEIWSFDIEDCKKHDLKYNHQFFFRNAEKETLYKPELASDVFFVGKDKNRLSLLMKLDEMMKNEGLTPCIHVIGERRDVMGNRVKYNMREKAFLKTKEIPYEIVLQYNKASKCLLEIMQAGQVGLTLRMVEAMFFNKKIITNNISVKQFDFYSPDNIYIIGEDSRSISDFVLNENFGWDEKWQTLYSFEHWLQIFDEG